MSRAGICKWHPGNDGGDSGDGHAGHAGEGVQHHGGHGGDWGSVGEGAGATQVAVPYKEVGADLGEGLASGSSAEKRKSNEVSKFRLAK